MSGLLYLITLIVVPWLVAWTIRDPARPSAFWWPFDMKGDEVPAPPKGWRAKRAAALAGRGRAATPMPEEALPDAGQAVRLRASGGRAMRRPPGSAAGPRGR